MEVEYLADEGSLNLAELFDMQIFTVRGNFTAPATTMALSPLTSSPSLSFSASPPLSSPSISSQSLSYGTGSPHLPPPSPLPSSSANTIPIPGRSILKKPPPAQASLFSRLSRFLPASNNAANNNNSDPQENARVLKRAHFILPEIAEEMRAIEERERERRQRVVRSLSTSSLNSPMVGGDSVSIRSGVSGQEEALEWWAMDKVESFYRECWECCLEPPDKGIMQAVKTTPPTHPRTVDFSGVQLTPASAHILADVLSIEWELRKAVFRECDLEEGILVSLRVRVVRAYSAGLGVGRVPMPCRAIRF
ncbi:hypothetical protein C8J57DRAFT_1721230 [Mycena rebaudengoi]|nr:hypothetical protein C8J57DRAFT_1721230 [Mycena rebaudengoi]